MFDHRRISFYDASTLHGAFLTTSPPRIPIRTAVTPELDAPLYKILPSAPDALIMLFRSLHMKFMWQAGQFSTDELRALGFTDADIVWIATSLARANVPLGMIVGANPLLTIPGETVPMPPRLIQAHHWVYSASIWQLITSKDNFSRLVIADLLKTTPYHIGMTATELFVSAGSP